MNRNENIEIVVREIEKNGLLTELLYKENNIRYVVFYPKDMRWIAFVEGSYDFPEGVYEASPEKYVYLFGFFNLNNMLQSYLLGITEEVPSLNQINEMIQISLNVLENDVSFDNLSYQQKTSAFKYWKMSNGFAD